MDVIPYNQEELVASSIGSSIDDESLEQDYDDEEQSSEIPSEPISTNDNNNECDIEYNDILPFRKSLFAHVAPYIIFELYNSTGHNIPQPIVKYLKWKWSTITPQLVRRTIVNSGFRLVKKSNDWIGTWGKHMKSNFFKFIKKNQKVNHFPGTFQIGRKDRLWRNLARLMSKYGRKEFNFVPKTYVLPQDLKNFRQIWEKNGGKEKWIIKPPASARGTGIRVVNKWSQIPKKKPLIVQQYLSKPLLIDGAKFDLRLYVLVTSFNPLRIYIYPDGLVRFASVKYNDDINNISDRLMHLTNYSINKTSSNYTKNNCADSCQGHKWTIKTFLLYLKKQGVDTDKLWTSINDIVVKTMISGEPFINTLIKNNTTTNYTCYELFGIDILLDSSLKPWLLEVNISPSLQSSSELDTHVKGPLVQNLLSMVGFQLPNLPTNIIEKLEKLYNYQPVCQNVKFGKALLTQQEKKKQALYFNLDREDYIDDILDHLTPDDVRKLISYEDELTQADKFQRIFPTKTTFSYLDYFDVPRYYNLLFDAWETKYSDNRNEGILRLQKLCQDKYHI
ncbi:tubulin polyglutamylase TTLL4-like [Aphidius gifuensis]|uniref:tubulin polyglutamylase TTLL4-like n=1 Tax=Aphidius gifuensis TaxID=684658 RepID=UPI001CDCE8AF|nr:tubulin polyglutamylase TTLL4-like [Aphidius gifuensis]XP_044007978.1 tubulin polyglutamylase TTLL4-like [Aphidius gifuensis]XP_044007980.1 tubulin polyglutamylase TTLL4-like [Aphidius gifuensis]XP_044007981.1 tubulin polyglutamylase TTLL4-like [Aphidius gifuensis]XP_044007982.1 tubulin polyglutamylase TTLL4-like [Aphidius gifuensis]XP_044007983.1 tubulin polyglutamylase TTLL4-like [Aphidius gifuensis]XP_044007984.1 tubulin polyglutamylase TTLL4-like [Aphidius gifuensis]XP_044007985.1 tub